MTTRSFPWTGCTPARTLTSSTVAALSLALCGCGINVAPPSVDSGTNSTDEGDTSVASTNSNYSSPPSNYSSPPVNTSTPAADPHGAMDPATTGAGDPYAAGLESGATGADPAMHGAEAGPVADDTLAGAMHGAGDPAAGELGPAEMEARRAQFEAENGGGAGAVPEDPAMRAQFEAQNPAANGGAAFDAADRGAQEDGADRGGRGGGRAGQFEEGSAPYVVMQMVEAIDAGDLETAAKYISDDADGLLASVRTGDAGENQLRELQSYFATMEPLSQRPRTRSITLNFNGGQNKVLSFVVVREGREFLVESLTVHDAQGRGR